MPDLRSSGCRPRPWHGDVARRVEGGEPLVDGEQERRAVVGVEARSGQMRVLLRMSSRRFSSSVADGLSSSRTRSTDVCPCVHG
jgi:hypothetical protein